VDNSSGYGTGPGDPRAWVQAAYVITAALEHGSDRVAGY
jgi:hypothetical protein